MLLLQSVLVCKAREVYPAMLIDSQYDLVKKEYKLVLEAYQQNFRNYKKGEKQKYISLIRQMVCIQEVAKDIEKLRQLILEEAFKACVPTSIKMYIDKQKATTLHQAAVLADDYSLTHRSSSVPTESGGSAGNKDEKPYPEILEHRLVSIANNTITVKVLISCCQ